MPAIDNKTHSLLQGLSDFWTRFYADTEELEAFYRGTEVLFAQAYLDLLSSFLNISVTETPLFNTELFKLITVREDALVFDAALNPADHRYRFELPDSVVEAHILQNKVIDPTASLEEDAGYETDTTNLDLLFVNDPAGRTLRELATITDGNLLAYGISPTLKRFYVTTGTPFATAQPGYWLKITNSGSLNNHTYRIARVIDSQAVLLQPTTSAPLTSPDVNNGSLLGTLYDSTFVPELGFAHRVVAVEVGGSFDDETTRQTTEIESWYADAPVGLGVRKGDILRILDSAAVPSTPIDFTIALVRHDKLYLSASTPPDASATGIASYAILREGASPDVAHEALTFFQTGTPKSGTNGSLIAGSAGTPARTEEVILETVAAVASTDRQRFIDVSGTGAITCTASISRDGVLTRTAGMSNFFVRGAAGGTVTITGSPTNNGTYFIDEIIDDGTANLLGTTFTPEAGITATLDSVTNDGTYRIKKIYNTDQLVLDLPAGFDDANNGSISWTIHDGWRANLLHSRVQRDTTIITSSVGDAYTGGLRRPIEGTDYTIDYEDGSILQIGRHANDWRSASYASYSWYVEVAVVTSTGAGELDVTEIEAFANEVAFWAPDVLVDRFNLYNNYGYLINRFDASSETYREFIRGVFQLYLLGPTMERIESALNVIAAFPVIRDDDEVFKGYDDTGTEYNVITTLRPNGDTATYSYPKTLPLRADVSDAAQWSGNVDVLTFESFEALSLAFQVSDYIDDPSWWTNIVIPRDLLPSETAGRRQTINSLVDNVVGAWDQPRVGDPGLFVGADDEGNVPSFIATDPAKRRKMANVVMERFLKWNVFFARFDTALSNLLDEDFIRDLTDLILVAKPGYRYLYFEPYGSFSDTLYMTESDLLLTGGVASSEVLSMGESTLTVQSFSWNVGDVWRYATPVSGQALVVADGIAIPNGGAAISLGATYVITKFVNVGGSPSPIVEDVDYAFDYAAGTLTPTTVWPAGTYTVDFHNIIITAAASKDPSLGDTDYAVGGLDPALVRNRHSYMHGASITTSGSLKHLNDVNASFLAARHEGAVIRVHEPVAARYTILRVVSATQALLYPDGDLTPRADVVWAFPSEEPLDGEFAVSGGTTYFRSSSATFQPWHVGTYLRVKDATNGANNGRHLVLSVDSMYQITVATGPVDETDLHWRLEGGQQRMNLVERPLQITVT